MAYTAFDSHAFYKELVEAGADERLAEVLSKDRLNLVSSEMATKADIEVLKTDIEDLRNELTAKIDTKIEMQSKELTIRMGGMFIVAVGILIGAISIMLP